jgi:hypothetical protein
MNDSFLRPTTLMICARPDGGHEARTYRTENGARTVATLAVVPLSPKGPQSPMGWEVKNHNAATENVGNGEVAIAFETDRGLQGALLDLLEGHVDAVPVPTRSAQMVPARKGETGWVAERVILKR